MRPRVLLSDVDNTLFSWIDYFAPSFRAMVHAISRETSFDEDDLYDAFQLTFQREGSVEFREAIQGNGLIQQLDPIDQDRMVELGQLVFSKVMRSHLKPYPDVVDTLKQLRHDGVSVVAVTNSDALQAMSRLKRMGLAKLIDGLVAWRSGDPRRDDASIGYEDRLAQQSRRDGFGWVHALPHGLVKPHIRPYQVALTSLGLDSAGGNADVWVIGDSLTKDLLPAQQMGLRTVWASYGHQFQKKNFDTLRRITHWSAERVSATYETGSLVPDLKVGSFSELLDTIPLQQPALF